MAWLVIGFVCLLVFAMGCAFFVSARAILRDMNERVAAFEARLERDANAVLDELLQNLTTKD
jgi:uncharacterized membrane protein